MKRGKAMREAILRAGEGLPGEGRGEGGLGGRGAGRPGQGGEDGMVRGAAAQGVEGLVAPLEGLDQAAAARDRAARRMR